MNHKDNVHFNESPARRATRSLGLVLVGTAALGLGGLPGCKDERARTSPQQQQGQGTASTRPYRSGAGYVGGAAAGAAAARSGGYRGTAGVDPTRAGIANNDDGSQGTRVSRGGFGATGRGAGS